MWLFGFFLLALGLVCMAGMAVATKRYGSAGGLPGPGAEQRAHQYRMVAAGTAVAGAIVLLLCVIVSGPT